MKSLLFASLSAFIVARAFAQPDWTALNAQARREALVPIRPGVPGKAPFWNGHARAFIHPPAFSFTNVAGAASYRFTLTPEQGAPVTWTVPEPWTPLKADVWNSLAPAYYTVKAEGMAADGTSVGVAGERKFYRAAVFKGPYAPAKTDYRAAARRVYASVFNLPHVQAWATNDDPPKGYDLYCYPAKILSSMIRALVRHAKYEPKDAARALALARKMADWMIAQSQPAGAPLAHCPPTYWGDRRAPAVQWRGQNMLSYPTHAANAYFDLAEATGDAKYRDAALNIARTFVRIQEADGTWPLKVFEKDGKPVRANRLVPGRYVFRMLDVAAQVSGDRAFSDCADRALGFLLKGPCVNWNWDGQFEDVDPLPPYRNLQKGAPVDTANRLFAKGGNVELAREIVAWCEDQFTVWSDPVHHMDWKHWKMPTALEQYEYYTPIDASMGDMIGAYASAYRVTKDPLLLAKGKSLADNITRHQRADGTIPTYFDSRKGSDWVNCMVYVADRLEALADAE